MTRPLISKHFCEIVVYLEVTNTEYVSNTEKRTKYLK